MWPRSKTYIRHDNMSKYIFHDIHDYSRKSGFKIVPKSDVRSYIKNYFRFYRPARHEILKQIIWASEMRVQFKLTECQIISETEGFRVKRVFRINLNLNVKRYDCKLDCTIIAIPLQCQL